MLRVEAVLELFQGPLMHIEHFKNDVEGILELCAVLNFNLLLYYCFAFRLRCLRRMSSPV